MGQRDKLSNDDMQKIRRRYTCKRQQSGFSGIPSYVPSGSNAVSNSGITTDSNAGHSIGANINRHLHYGRELFNTYTSPQFWQRFVGSFLFPQPARYHQNYNDGYLYGFGY